VVLRHQLKVLRRQVRRPKFRPFDPVSSPPRLTRFRGTGGPPSSSRPRRCSGGTANSSGGSGPTATRASLDVLGSIQTSRHSCSASLGRTRGGVTFGSKENCGRSASGWARRPSEGFFVLTDSAPLLGARAPPGLSSGPGTRRPGHRLLHRGDDPAEDSLRPILHRSSHPTGPSRRRHNPSRLRMGHPAGQEPGHRGCAPDCEPPHPRSGLEVLRAVRRGLPHGRSRRRPDSVPGSSGQRLRRERWVRSVRAECLDWTLVRGRQHLERVLRTYTSHYNRGRPHRGLGLDTPGRRPPRSRRAPHYR